MRFTLKPNPCPASLLLTLLSVFLLLPSSFHFVRTKRIRHLSILFSSHRGQGPIPTNVIIIPEFLFITVYVFSRVSVTLENFDFISVFLFFLRARYCIFHLYISFTFLEIYAFQNFCLSGFSNSFFHADS